MTSSWKQTGHHPDSCIMIGGVQGCRLDSLQCLLSRNNSQDDVISVLIFLHDLFSLYCTFIQWITVMSDLYETNQCRLTSPIFGNGVNEIIHATIRHYITGISGAGPGIITLGYCNTFQITYPFIIVLYFSIKQSVSHNIQYKNISYTKFPCTSKLQTISYPSKNNSIHLKYEIWLSIHA